MTERYTGGCACGTIRYEASDAPLFANRCRCRDCQRRSGTGHGSYLSFPRREAGELEGRAVQRDVAGDSGHVKSHAFCPPCGSPVHLTFSAMPDLFTAHATSLDDPTRSKPQAVTYRMRGHAWDHPDPAPPQFETMPP